MATVVLGVARASATGLGYAGRERRFKKNDLLLQEDSVMTSEPICVRRTATVEEADMIVAWLVERGVQSMVMDRDNPGVMAFGVTDEEGIAVCVADSETADRAEALLDEHDKEAAARTADPSAGPIEAVCEDCGKTSTFPATTSGTVQECNHCGCHVDVP